MLWSWWQSNLVEAEGLKVVGNEQFKQGLYGDALDSYRAALEAAPDQELPVPLRAALHLNSGICHIHLVSNNALLVPFSASQFS